MEVFVFASWYPTRDRPGRGVFFQEQAEMLLARGHEVSVIVTERRRMGLFGYLKHALSGGLFARPLVDVENGVEVIRSTATYFLPGRYFGDFTVPLLVRDADRMFRSYNALHGKPDVLHAHAAFHGGFCAARIARREKLPLVVTEHRSNYLSSNLSRINIMESRFVARNAMMLIFVSEYLRGAFLDILPRNINPRTVVIGNIVNKIFFEIPIRMEKKDRFVFCHVANLVPIKNQAFLLESFSLALMQGLKLELAVIGDGVLRERLKKKAAELRISEWVKFIGALDRPRVAEVMAASDGFILSSDHETFGLVVAEALAVGLPCVVTKCGGPSEFINDTNGILVEKGEPAVFASAIAELVGNYRRYDRKKIRSEARMGFSEETIIPRLENCYIDRG